MMTRLGRLKRGGLARLAAIGVLAGGLTSCGLDVFDPDIVTPEDVADPASIPFAITGVVGDFQEALDNVVRKGGMFTDEFILSGTFPTRVELDTRRVTVDNATLIGPLYEPIHVSRFSADNIAEQLAGLVGDPDVDPDLVSEGIAFGQYYGAYARVFLAEIYCQSILGGGDPLAVNFESGPVLPDARMAGALSLFQQAEASALAAGRPDVASAAKVGAARANMWLANYSQAAATAATVDPDFAFISEYSSNTIAQYNEVYQFTYNDAQALRWTVGDGTQIERNLEKYAYYDEWVDVGLIDPDPSTSTFQAFNSAIRVHLQLIYGKGNAPPTPIGQAASILIASGFEADIMRAEAAYRTGDLAGAAAIINARITTGDNPHGNVHPPVAFTGTFATDIAEIGRAYAVGTWLTGHRLGFVRRVLRNDGVDFFPPTQPGLDTALPLVQQEIDNNENVSVACPSGPPWS